MRPRTARPGRCTDDGGLDRREIAANLDGSENRPSGFAVAQEVENMGGGFVTAAGFSSIFGTTNRVIFGDLADLENVLFKNAIDKIDLQKYVDKKVVVKGCGKFKVPTAAYIELTRVLRPYVSNIMYGEPCSTVPIYKAVKKA